MNWKIYFIMLNDEQLFYSSLEVLFGLFGPRFDTSIFFLMK